MSFTFKLARRTARLRVAVCATLLLALACSADETTAPVTEPTPEAEPPAAELLPLWPSWATSEVNSAKSEGMRIFVGLAGSKSYYTNSNGTFNMTKWKSRINLYEGTNFASFVSAGTVFGHYLVDEPFCTSCWGGQKITASQIGEMARYSKSIWPSMPTAVRSPPTLLANQTYRYLDVAWAQWEGPHVPSYGLTPEQFRDKQIAAASYAGQSPVAPAVSSLQCEMLHSPGRRPPGYYAGASTSGRLGAREICLCSSTPLAQSSSRRSLWRSPPPSPAAMTAPHLPAIRMSPPSPWSRGTVRAASPGSH